MLDTLFNHIFITRRQADSSERALQLNFIEHIKALQDNEDLHLEIKAYLNTLQGDINKWAKKNKGASNELLKIHFEYCFKQSIQND